MIILFILIDLAILTFVTTGAYFIYKRMNRKKDTLKNVKYNMEVFHDPDMLLKYQNNYDRMQPNNFTGDSYKESVNDEQIFSHDDGNDLIRDRIKNKRFANSHNDLAEKTATPFEHGGMNMHNQGNGSNDTNYLNF
jgi:hypothetical protein